MLTSTTALVSLSFIGSVLAQGYGAPGCVATSYFFSTQKPSTVTVSLSTSTSDVYVLGPDETTFVPTVIASVFKSSTLTTSTRTKTTVSGTTTVTKTRTTRLSSTITSSCPVCLSPTGTTTISYIFPSVVTKVLTLKVITSTFTYSLQVDGSVTTATSTVTSGSPPTTRTVTTTLRQKTVTSTYTYYLSTKQTTTTVTTGLSTVTVKKTVTAALPKKTVTITLFSAQLFNHQPEEDFNLDTIDYNGTTAAGTGENHALVPQNSSVVTFYVAPGTGRIVELSSGRHWEETCGDEGCEPRSGVVLALDGENPDSFSEGGGKLYERAYTNCTAVCGQPIFCNSVWFGILEYDFTYVMSAGFGQYSGGQALFAVGPTAGFGGNKIDNPS